LHNPKLDSLYEAAVIKPVESRDIWLFWEWDDRPTGGVHTTFTGHIKEGERKMAD